MRSQRSLGALAARLRPGRHTPAGRVAAEPVPGQPAAPATLPATYALGDAYTTADGLRVTVLDVQMEQADDRPRPLLVMHARVENATAATVAFDNMLGVLDQGGESYPRRYTDPARHPSSLPGVATLAPGDVIEGDVYVDVEVGTSGTFRPVFLMAVQRGCGGCPTGPVFDLFPLARWQPVSL